MTVTVNAFPAGLRDLLGQRGAPEPYIFHPGLTLPTIDLATFLTLAIRNSQQATASPTVSGVFATHLVPANQLWWILAAVSYTDALDADQSTALRVVTQIGGFPFYSNQVLVPASTFGTVRMESFPDAPLILRPGDAVSGQVNELVVGAAGSITLTTNLLVAILQD